MAQPWKPKSSRRIDIDNIPTTFSSLSQLAGMSNDAMLAMLYGDSLSEAMMGEEEALYGGAMLPGMEMDEENALEKVKYQMENPNAIMTPWGPALSPEEMDMMLQDNYGLEFLIGVPESQQAELMADADLIMNRMGNELDDVKDIGEDMGMRENISPFESMKNLAGDVLLGAIDSLFPPDTVYGAEPGMPDQTDQMLDGGSPGLGDILGKYAGIWATRGDPNLRRGEQWTDEPIYQPEVVQRGAGKENPDPEIKMILDSFMANTDPSHFLDKVTEMLQEQDDPDNPGQTLEPILSPYQVGLWLNQLETPLVVNEQINPNHPLRSIIEPLYDVLSGTTEGMPTTTGVTQQPTVSETQQVSSNIPSIETQQVSSNIPSLTSTDNLDIRNAILNAQELTPGVNYYRPFYNAINKLENAGDPDFRAAIPTIMSDTLALFWFWEGDKAFATKDNPETTEKLYADFLDRYISGELVEDVPSTRRGKAFNDRVQWLGELMEEDQQNTQPKPDNEWLRAMFIDGDIGQRNTQIISDLYRTRGSREWHAGELHKQNAETRSYWRNVKGESNTDIFRRLTAQRPKVEGESQIMDDEESILRPPERIQSGWKGI